jgi:CheY-like chemotaxis protein
MLQACNLMDLAFSVAPSSPSRDHNDTFAGNRSPVAPIAFDTLSAVSKQHDRHQRQVMVVDDDALIASTLGVVLTLSGISATAFTDPVEALAAAALDVPDLLISDLHMPGMPGIDFAARVKQMHGQCEVLLLSGSTCFNEAMRGARARGFQVTCLSKPVAPPVLVSVVRQLIDARAQPGVSPSCRRK